ncbi:MAG: lipoprotein insertase outer membrane protein LolB [Pseudomonadales bacterium]
MIAWLTASSHRLGRCNILLILSALAACAPITQQTTLPDSQRVDWPRHQQLVGALDDWDIMGKLGIRTPDQSNSARFNWQQQAQHFDIRVTSLLGQGLATLSGTSGNVHLNIAGRGEFDTSVPEALLLQELGWTLPVDDLNYWIRGIPSPNSQARYQLNDQGLMENLHQAGWQLHFSRYQQFGSFPLPGKILLQQDDIKLTLLIKQWSLHTSQQP